jgi:beta-lactamase superfamily II metal-dependent hydrolase
MPTGTSPDLPEEVDVFDIDMVPAARGDCLWLEYGNGGRVHRVLIDGGLVSTWRNQLRPRIEALPVEDRRFDLLVITHIDLDHIAGILELLRDPPEGLIFDDVWFNGWDQIEDKGVLGPRQGEAVSEWLRRREWAWNEAFDGAAVALDEEDEPVSRTLTGGMVLTLLSPTRKRLGDLRAEWKAKIEAAHLVPGAAGADIEGLVGHPEDAGIDPGILGAGLDPVALARLPFRADASKPNGSSIAFLAEYDGHGALLTGDAFAGDVQAAARSVLRDRNERRLHVDALKLSHHGGRKNTSPELLDSLACSRFLFSTDGSMYRHPDRESVARAIVHGRAAGRPTIVFNHRTQYSEVWDDRMLFRGANGYDPLYPEGDAGIRVSLA